MYIAGIAKKFYYIELGSLVSIKENDASCGYGKIHDGTFSSGIVDGNGIFAQMLVDEGIRVITEEEYN